MLKVRMTAGIVVAIFLLSVLAGYGAGDDLNTIHISPQQKTVVPGEVFTININITAYTPVSSAACDISFDPAILQALNITNGGMFEVWLGELEGVADIDNVNGTINYIFAFSGTGHTGEGVFAQITFQAIAPGTSEIIISNPIIHGQSPPDIAVVNGQVDVTGSHLSYSPTFHNFGDMSEGQTDSTTFDIWNSGTGTLTYSLSESCDWVLVIPTSGTSTGEHDTITVNIDTTGLSPGLHICTISITSNGGSGTFTVQVNIVAGAILSYSPTSHDFGSMLAGQTDSTTFDIWNSGTGTLTYSLSESCGWVTVTPTGGTSTGEHDTITVNIDTTGLSVGVHTCDITITSDGGSGTFTVQVTIVADTTPPEINNIDASPSPQTINGYVNISCTITDNVGVDEAKVFITYPDASVHEFDLLLQRGDYYFTQQYTVAGIYEYYIYAKDVNGLDTASRILQFEIIETDEVPPVITDVAVSPALQDFGEDITISCNVTDNVGVADVRIRVTYPDDSIQNFSIYQNHTGDMFYSIKSYQLMGAYEFYIYAVDTSGNGNVSSVYGFEIDDLSPPVIENVSADPPTQNVGDHVNISCTVTDNVEVDEVFLIVIYPDDSHINISISHTDSVYFSNRAYSLIGTYEFYLYALDTSGHSIQTESHTFEMQDLTPPEVEIVAPATGAKVGDDVLIKWNATDNAANTTLLITIKYSPNNGITWHNIVTDTENDGEYVWNTTGLDDSNEYLLEISAKDASNNVGKAISDEFTVDNTVPSIIIEKPEGGKMYVFDREVLPLVCKKAFIIGKITVQATPSDTLSGIAKVEFHVDGTYKAQVTTSPYEWTWDEKIFGAHTIKVTAYDNAGNKIEKEIEVFIINPL